MSAAFRLSRRRALAVALGAVAMPAVVSHRAQAMPDETGVWQHALTLLDEPKHAPGFASYDFVNPQAPKGGLLRIGAVGAFDNLNLAVMRGTLADAVYLTHEQLFSDSLDEIATAYGQIAEAVRVADDFASVSFRLDSSARWHDGQPITSEDVVFSLQALKTASPLRALHYRDIIAAEAAGPREVTFRFARPGIRGLPKLASSIVVLPRHWWRERTAEGARRRDIRQTTLEAPLGSGPYRVAAVVPGRSVVLERVEDHWGAARAVNVGRHNFSEIRVEYFRDDTAAFEAFRGGKLDWRNEDSTKIWATAYDFPAVKDGEVIREAFPVRRFALMHALTFNLRRGIFASADVREAFDLAFDYEDIDRTLMYGDTVRADSFWAGSELACRALPDGAERALLEPLRPLVPPAVFDTPYRNPRSGSSGAVRDNLKAASRLLKRAGWTVIDQRRINTFSNEPLTVEILLNGAQFERQMLVYKAALERLGIDVSLRIVDSPQYANRLRERDFDLIVHAYGMSLVPGSEQRDLWGSEAADQAASSNVGGIKDRAVDALVEAVTSARTRPELVAATRALDRVLLARHYVVPLWRHDRQRTARWSHLARPPTLPAYGASAFPSVWWSSAAGDGGSAPVAVEPTTWEGDIAMGGAP